MAVAGSATRTTFSRWSERSSGRYRLRHDRRLDRAARCTHAEWICGSQPVADGGIVGTSKAQQRSGEEEQARRPHRYRPRRVPGLGDAPRSCLATVPRPSRILDLRLLVALRYADLLRPPDERRRALPEAGTRKGPRLRLARKTEARRNVLDVQPDQSGQDVANRVAGKRRRWPRHQPVGPGSDQPRRVRRDHACGDRWKLPHWNRGRSLRWSRAPLTQPRAAREIRDANLAGGVFRAGRPRAPGRSAP